MRLCQKDNNNNSLAQNSLINKIDSLVLIIATVTVVANARN